MSHDWNDTQTPKDYSDGRTKQAFEKDTNINKLLAKHQKQGTLSTLQAQEGQYGEFEGYDLLEAFQKVDNAKRIFSELPSQVRREFGENPVNFINFVGDPANADRLETVLPHLAAPGFQFPNVGGEPQIPDEAAAPGDPGRPEDPGPPAEPSPPA